MNYVNGSMDPFEIAIFKRGKIAKIPFALIYLNKDIFVTNCIYRDGDDIVICWFQTFK